MNDKTHFSTLQIFDTLLKDIKGRSGTPKFSTEIEELDELIWGLHKKELMVIGARPSHGKTSLAINIAWNLAKKKVPCVFVSLEMSKESILERVMCNELNINGWRLRKGVADEIKKAEDNISKFNSILLKSTLEIIDYKGKTIKDIKEIIEEFQPAFIFIDHAQKISSSGYMNKYEALSDYVNTLQGYAIKYECGVVLNSQINRQGSQQANATDYFKGSGEIEESADTLLQCRWVVRENPKHFDPKEFEINVLKQRHGACDFRTINFDAGTFKFTSKKEADNIDNPLIRSAKSIFLEQPLTKREA